MENAAIEQVEKKVSSLQLNVSAVIIRDQQTYDKTVTYMQVVKDMQNSEELVQLEEAKLAAHDAHKKISDLFNRIMNPLKAMEATLKNKLLTWDRAKQADEDRKRREAEAKRQAEIKAEQDRLAATARAEAAKQAAAAAAQAKRDGESKAAQERARKQAEADSLARRQAEDAERIAAMEAAPLPEAKPAYQRDASVQTRDNWCWEFDVRGTFCVMQLVEHVAKHPEDLYLLEPERLIESHPALNKVAKAQKTMCRLPGGRAVNKGSVAASAR